MDVYFLESFKNEMTDCLKNTIDVYKKMIQDKDCENITITDADIKHLNKFEKKINIVEVKLHDYKETLKNGDPAYLFCVILDFM